MIKSENNRQAIVSGVFTTKNRAAADLDMSADKQYMSFQEIPLFFLEKGTWSRIALLCIFSAAPQKRNFDLLFLCDFFRDVRETCDDYL